MRAPPSEPEAGGASAVTATAGCPHEPAGMGRPSQARRLMISAVRLPKAFQRASFCAGCTLLFFSMPPPRPPPPRLPYAHVGTTSASAIPTLGFPPTMACVYSKATSPTCHLPGLPLLGLCSRIMPQPLPRLPATFLVASLSSSP